MYRISENLFLQKRYNSFKRIISDSTFDQNCRTRLPLSIFMSCKENLKSLFELTIESRSADFLSIFNLVNDSLKNQKLDILLEEMKVEYYGNKSSQLRQDKRQRIIELICFINSELFYVLLNQK
jgi:hypothetical protein